MGKCCVSAVRFPAKFLGRSCRICTFIAIPKKPRKRNKKRPRRPPLPLHRHHQAEEWNQTDQYQPVVEDWAEPNATLPPAAAAVPIPVAAEIPAAPMVVDEWGAQTAQDWAGEAPKAAPAAEWGGGVTESWN